MKTKKTKLKNTLEWINSSLNKEEEWISELEDRIVEITDDEQKKRKKNEKKWGKFKRPLGKKNQAC